MATLQSYVTDARRLLHDSSGKYWTDLDLIAYVNKARVRTVADTSCYRQLQSLYLSTGLEQYTYGGVTGATITDGSSGYVAAPNVTFTGGGGSGAAGTAVILGGAVTDILITSVGEGYTSAPVVAFDSGAATATATVLNAATMDVLNIAVIWGNLRIILDRYSYTQFLATVRAWQAFNQRPVCCASYGQSRWFLGPIPDQSYPSEWDTVMTPTDLVNMTDADTQIGPLYTEPVAFYAARWAKYQQQEFAEAAQFDNLYRQQVARCVRSTMLRKMQSAYGS